MFVCVYGEKNKVGYSGDVSFRSDLSNSVTSSNGEQQGTAMKGKQYLGLIFVLVGYLETAV